MKIGYGIIPRKERSPEWVNDKALFWPYGRFNEADLKAMAELIDPKHVLIHNWGMWNGFNRRIPEYIPRDKDYVKKTALAHGYGYHVGGYFSMLLVDVATHPDIMEKYSLDYSYDGLTKEKPLGSTRWLVNVHPGSQKWRNFYTEKMKTVHRNYGVDLLYQDVSGGPIGSAGVINELTKAAAVVACEDEIRRSLPNAALMGEYWTEVNACREDFALSNYLNWFNDDFKQYISKRRTVHPILSCLFSDFCLRMAYSSPFRDINRFHKEENINEVTGSVPYWNTTITDQLGEAIVTLKRARYWSEGFRPFFPEEWESDVIAYMKNDRDEVIRYVANGESTFCYQGEERKLEYARVTGVSEIRAETPVHIKPWIAYDTNGPIGLNSDQWYCVFPGEPSDLPIVLTELPPSATIQGARITKDFVLIQLGGTGAGIVKWKVNKPYSWLSTSSGRLKSSTREVHVELPTHIIFAYRMTEKAADLNLHTWRPYIVSHGWVSETAKARRGSFYLKNGRVSNGYQVLPPTGGKDVEISLDRLYKIPKKGNPALKAVFGMISKSSGDGVHIVVRINGSIVMREHRKKSSGELISVPLAAYAGQDVILSLGVDCGPSGFNTSSDWSFWDSIRISQ
jgi:hypothetical protein